MEGFESLGMDVMMEIFDYLQSSNRKLAAELEDRRPKDLPRLRTMAQAAPILPNFMGTIGFPSVKWQHLIPVQKLQTIDCYRIKGIK